MTAEMTWTLEVHRFFEGSAFWGGPMTAWDLECIKILQSQQLMFLFHCGSVESAE